MVDEKATIYIYFSRKQKWNLGPFTQSGHQIVQVSCVLKMKEVELGACVGPWYPHALVTFILLPHEVHTCLGEGIYMLQYLVLTTSTLSKWTMVKKEFCKENWITGSMDSAYHSFCFSYSEWWGLTRSNRKSARETWNYQEAHLKFDFIPIPEGWPSPCLYGALRSGRMGSSLLGRHLESRA